MLFHFILFLFTFPLTMVAESAHLNNTSKLSCPTRCGNITVPYPFGIGTNCSLDHSFHLTCDTSNNKTPKLFLGDGKLQIYNILDSELRIFTTVSYSCYNQSGFVREFESSVDLGANRAFTFSTKNKFTVIGCDDYAFITGTNRGELSGGCFGLCRKADDVPNGQCSGIGCCQTSIPDGLLYYNTTLHSLTKHLDISSFNECGYCFLVEEGVFEFGGAHALSTNYLDFTKRIESTLPVVLDWVVAPKGNCTNGHVCQGNSSCYDVDGGGYRCKCNNGYEGNPYLALGCQDINECNDQGTNPCYGVCINTVGSYKCTCLPGSFGDASIPNGCQHVQDSKYLTTSIIIGNFFMHILMFRSTNSALKIDMFNMLVFNMHM